MKYIYHFCEIKHQLMEFFERLSKILNYKIIDSDYFSISLFKIGELIILFIVTRILIYILRIFLVRFEKKENLDKGSMFALYQILKYIFIVIAITIGLEALGVKITLLIAGSAALFVGLGLGLQQIFKDFVSGFIFLIERTAKVGEIVEVDGHVARVLKIGLRTTEIETRDRIKLVVPNSKFISDTVINWSNNRTATRFGIRFRVRYGSDVKLVKRIALETVAANLKVEKQPAPQLVLDHFGDDGLEFLLLFHSYDLFRIEFVKSNIRYALEEAFVKHDIKFGFTQLDIHIKDLPPKF